MWPEIEDSKMGNEQAITELKDIYENDIPNKNDYYTSTAFEMAFKALEKQIPKPPLHSGLCYDCPSCLETV